MPAISVRTHLIDSWEKLSERLYLNSSPAFGSLVWIYRGIQSASYPLIPKAARDDFHRTPGLLGRRDYSWDNEREYLLRFIRASRPYISPAPSDDRLTEWMAIGQHHGLPTRLLDWTESALVAAFFAVEPSGIIGGETVDPAIYCIAGLRELYGGDDPFAQKTPRIYKPPHISARIPAQSALFSLQPDPTTDFLEQIPDGVGVQLEKWQISAEFCFELKLILNRLGINRASLFPDLDGLAKHIEWLYKWHI